MICQYCGTKLFEGSCTNPACPGTLIVHKFNLPDGKLVEIADERVWIYDGPFDYLTIDEIDVIHAEIHRNALSREEQNALIDESKKKMFEPKPPQESKKEPWEIPVGEYVNRAAQRVSGQSAPKTRKLARTYHSLQVRQAIKEGRNVPPEVLKDYPKLTQKPHDNIPDHFSPPTPPSREERIERAEKDLCSIFNVGENEHLCRQHISAILAELMEEKP